MAKLIASNQAELIAALETASAGDIIRLKAGNYGSLSLDGVSFDSAVVIRAAKPGAAAFASLDLNASANLTFRNLAIDSGNDPAIAIDDSSGIAVTGSAIEGAISVTGSSGIRLRENEIVGSDSAIRLENSEQIRVTGNTIRETGGTAIAGSGLGAVAIKDNLILTSAVQAISLENTLDSSVSRNTLLDPDGRNGYGPAIALQEGTREIEINGNVGSGIIGPVAADHLLYGISAYGNVTVTYDDIASETHIGNLFFQGTPGNGSAGIVAIPGSPAANAGAAITHAEGGNPAQFSVHADAGDPAALVFDAASFGPEGASYRWTFGDGTQAEGALVTHVFDKPGFYGVELEVTAGGGVTTATARAAVAGSEVAAFNPETGRFETGLFGQLAGIAAGDLPLVSLKNGYALAIGASETPLALPGSSILPFSGAGNFDLSFTIKATMGRASAGEIMRVQPGLTVTANADGTLGVAMVTDSGSVQVATAGGTLLDGARHEVGIVFDGARDNLVVSIDGVAQASAEIAGDLLSLPRDLTFGASWDAENHFTGRLFDFRLGVDAPVYSEFGSPAGEAAAGTETAVSAECTVGAIDPAAVSELSGRAAEAQIAGGSGAGPAFVADFTDVPQNALRGSAKLIEHDSAIALTTGGTGGKLVLGRIDAFDTAGRVAVEIGFEHGGGSSGGAERLFWKAGALGAAVKNGGLKLAVMGGDDAFQFIRTGDLGLDDGQAHQAVVLADENAGRLQVFVDEILVLDETGLDFGISDPGRWILAGSGQRGFDGTVTGFALDSTFAFADDTGLPF